jgi:heparosan-N-sulfate-glucuronate 5-epimerase
MPLASRLHYYQRIFSAYVLGGKSQLTFWHETPEVNLNSPPDRLGEYYMVFAEKARYAGYFDEAGIPMLDYRGRIGRQYNPIAIAQYGLAHYNAFCRTRNPASWDKVLHVAEWLTAHLENNPHGVALWNHHFDWEYRETLRAPWYSALAQGQGISLLVRAHQFANDGKYADAAERAFAAFLRSMEEGGVTFTDEKGDLWLEEYLVDPPTHILNGMIWAAWGLRDYFLVSGHPRAKELFDRAVGTLLTNLEKYDLGFWSLYEQSGTRLPMVASPFYHQLHIVQLLVMERLTGEAEFGRVAGRWEGYRQSRLRRWRALGYKAAFKVVYY